MIRNVEVSFLHSEDVYAGAAVAPCCICDCIRMIWLCGQIQKAIHVTVNYLTSILLLSLCSCRPLMLSSTLLLLGWSAIDIRTVYQLVTYISFSIYSNRLSTVLLASDVSCFNSTGPTSLYIFASSSRLANS